jgi:hypothetical protein
MRGQPLAPLCVPHVQQQPALSASAAGLRWSLTGAALFTAAGILNELLLRKFEVCDRYAGGRGDLPPQGRRRQALPL